MLSGRSLQIGQAAQGPQIAHTQCISTRSILGVRIQHMDGGGVLQIDIFGWISRQPSKREALLICWLIANVSMET